MLAVAGGKGGCGKTTTTVGLALAAGRRGRPVLAVDADVDGPDLHRVAGVDVVPGTDDTDRPLAVPGAPGVRVLPADPTTSPATLPTRLAGGRRADDLVLVDCPAGAGRDVAVPLRSADRTLVVSTADPPSLRDAAKTAAMSRAVGTPIAGAVLTRCRTVPAGVPDLLGTDSVLSIPQWSTPLQSPDSKRRHSRILAHLPAV